MHNRYLSEIEMSHMVFNRGNIKQGGNEVYFFIIDSVFLPEILIPDLKNVENFDP